jgi:calmodulin
MSSSKNQLSKQNMMTEEQIETYKVAFSMYDKNGDSKITIDELGDDVRNLGINPSKQKLSELLKEIDLDNSGTIEFNEFQIWMSNKMHYGKFERNEEDLLNCFKVFDENGDQFITAEELKSVMKRLGQNLNDDEINLMITEADIDGDNRINFKEFVQLMKKFDL